jgi:hypothetical protein
MRRILLSIGLILAATLAPLSAGHAQLTFGGFAGVNFSNLDISDPAAVPSSRTGGMFGGYIGTHMGRLFTIRLEGYWTRKGADVESSGSPAESFKINYIEVPLILRVHIPLVVIKPALYAGPAISFTTSCDSEVSGGPSVPCSDAGIDLKSTDFSGIIGAGVGVGPITLDVQYDFSFSNILEDDPTSNTEAKNKTWTVRAAFGI